MIADSGVSIRGLRVTYPGPPSVRALDAIALRLKPGESLGILGESGSGKSSLAHALLGLLPDARVEGEALLGDIRLTQLDEAGWRGVRWRQVALAFQSPSALNPVLTVGLQLTEPAQVHLGLNHAAASSRAVELLQQVGLDGGMMDRYPRELSGGQQRLVLIAMALICEPAVLVLDEPTAGLDPVTTENVLDLLVATRTTRRQTMLTMSHDPATLARLADRVAVLYRGWIAEAGPAREVLDAPRHPYAWALLNAHPSLGSIKDIRGIRGEPPDATVAATGCPFVDRCTQAIAGCDTAPPAEVVVSDGHVEHHVACHRGGLVSVLAATDLTKRFRGRMNRGIPTIAVDQITLEVRQGEVVGLVGPTGAGKSTLAKLLVRLLDADGGSVVFEGEDLLHADARTMKQLRRRIQLLFQDPFEALSPRMTIGEAVREPLDAQGIGTPQDRERAVVDALQAVRLPVTPEFRRRHTHQLSGGQLQRVALARALTLSPHLLVADEPVAMLDPSEQARMLQLLKSLQVERGMAMVFISHDLAVVLRIADRVTVLDHGRVVESGTGTQLLLSPQHDVTRALLAAAGRA